METIPSFRQYLYQQNLSSQTIQSYVRWVDLFLKTESEAEKYKYKDILDYVNIKAQQYPNSDFKATVLSAIKKYYDYLIVTGKRETHPCRNLFVKRMKNSKTIFLFHHFFSSQELELLLNREERYRDLRIKNQVVLSLLIYQGITAGELINLKLSHVDLDKGTVFIKESSKNSRRHLELLPKQFRIFNAYMETSRKKLLRIKTDALIVGKLGTPITIDDPNYLVSTFKGLFPDRDLNPKTIRQSVIANWLNEKKLPLEQVQLMAGHRWISSTLRYRQNDAESQREIINRFHPLG